MLRAVGRNVLRKDRSDKVSGAARYLDDFSFPSLLHARTVRSTVPAGEIAGIAYNFDTSGFTMQLRVEAFDVLNRPNRFTANNNPTSGSFGLITSKTGERVLQLAAKYSF